MQPILAARSQCRPQSLEVQQLDAKGCSPSIHTYNQNGYMYGECSYPQLGIQQKGWNIKEDVMLAAIALISDIATRAMNQFDFSFQFSQRTSLAHHSPSLSVFTN